MIYLLYGQDEFSLRETLSSLKEDVGTAELRDLNITSLDGSQVSFDELAATCNTVPFLAAKRLVIVEGLLSRFESRAPSRGRARAVSTRERGLEEWEGLSEYLPNVPESTDLVFVDGPLNNSNPLLGKVSSIAKTRGFPTLTGEGLRQWIRQRASKHEIDIEPGAVNTLAETIGSDLRVIDSELQKLSVYCWGRRVTDQDVQELVSYVKEANIFAAVDAALEGRSGVAVRLIHQLLDSGRPPAYILTMLARQVRLLLIAKDLKARGVNPAELGKRLSLSRYPLRKTLEQEGRFTNTRLIEIHRRLLEADIRMKTGDMDEQLALDMLVVEMSGGNEA